MVRRREARSARTGRGSLPKASRSESHGKERLTPRARTAAIVAGVIAAVALSAGAGAGTYAVLSDSSDLSIGGIYYRTH
jgi:hypothetical protein